MGRPYFSLLGKIPCFFACHWCHRHDLQDVIPTSADYQKHFSVRLLILMASQMAKDAWSFIVGSGRHGSDGFSKTLSLVMPRCKLADLSLVR